MISSSGLPRRSVLEAISATRPLAALASGGESITVRVQAALLGRTVRTQEIAGFVPIMSLNRFVYYCAVTAGWAALAAWLAAELLFFRSGTPASWWRGMVRDTLTAALLGGVLGAGLCMVSGMTNARWAQLSKRALPGLLGGLLGGGLGGLVGTCLYGLGAPRALGWLIMGMGIGATEGLYERSRRKLRNGLIGGTIGGLLGGLLFDPIATAWSEMSGRATAFVVLGISIGVLIGLAHVVLKEAWLTVLDGYRPGRQLILSKDTTLLGRAEHLALPFLGHADSELEPEHARITRQPSGQYVIDDNHTRIGTLVNSQPIHGPVTLRDGDLVKLGTNIVRFNHRHRAQRSHAPPIAPPAGAGTPIHPPAPPPVAYPPTPGSPAIPPGPPPVSGAAGNAGSGEAGDRSFNGPAHGPGMGPLRPPPPPPIGP